MSISDKLRIGLAWWLLSAAAFGASKPKTPGIGKEFAIPAEGIKLRVPSGAESRPLPAMRILSSHPSDGAALYHPVDFWRGSQLIGLWSGGGALAAAVKVEFAPPSDKAAPGSAGDLRRSMTVYSEIPPDKEIFRWIKNFFGENAIRSTKLNSVGDIYWRRIDTENRRCAIFFGHGKIDRTLRMVAVNIDWSNFPMADDNRWRKLAERCAFSTKFTSLPKKHDNDGNGYAERLAQAKKSIAGLRGWYVQETSSYIFVSNQRNRGDLKRLQRDLELARAIFNRYFPAPTDKSDAGVVKLFAERDEYLRYVGPDMTWTAGIWNPSVRELIVSPLGFKADDKLEEKFLRQVALHEGFHQYIFYVSRECNPGMWINEGCAQFFESSSPRRGEIGTLDESTETKLARAAAGAGDDLKRFVNLDHAGFYAEHERDHNYALSHALLYYLLRGAPALGEHQFAALPRRYIEILRDTRDPAKANSIAFADIDTRRLAFKLKEFWSNKKLLRSAKRYRQDQP